MPPRSVFSAISPSAQLIRTLFVWILILSAGIFAVVAGSVTLALVRFRARAGVPESADVIHDFWVPSLGPKVDAVPGHPNYVWLAADAPGTRTCSEYCGAEHAWLPPINPEPRMPMRIV
jgi:cytochrome c oxidase subunit 2